MSDVGSQVSTLALPLIAALTLDATAWQMGLLSAAGSAPVLLVGLLTGVWVDRRRRQPVLIATDLGRAILLSTVPLASALGVLRIDLLYVVTLLVGTLTVLFGVAHMSFVPSLLERERLVEGNSKLEATTSVAQVAGPGLGGVLVGVLGAPLAVLVDALSFLGSALVIAKIRVSEASPVTAPGRAGVLAEIGEGLRVVRRQPILLVLAGCSATTALFGAMFLAVYVLYMTRDLGLGAAAIGLVFATGGLGALAGALGAAAAARRFGPGPAMLGAQFLFGLAGIAVPLAVLVPRVALALVVASEFAQWMTFVAYRVNALSVRQAITPDRLQGRVNATMRFLIGGAFPIGAVIGGALGGAIGVPLTLAVASLGTLLPCLWLLQSPVRRLRTLPMVEPAGPALAM